MLLRYSKNTQPFLEVISYTTTEIKQLDLLLTKKSKFATFSPRYKKKQWDGNINSVKRGKYISKEIWDTTRKALIEQKIDTSIIPLSPIVNRNSKWFNIFKNIKSSIYVPLGLYDHIKTEMENYGFSVELENEELLVDNTIIKSEIEDFLKTLNVTIKGNPIQYEDHQVETIYKALKYKFCQQELATSSGKTLVSFGFFAYCKLVKKYKQCLMIVPKIGLLSQGINDFLDYGRHSSFKPRMDFVGDGQKEISDDLDIIIGTYQTLRSLDIDLFRNFDCVVIDEAHTAKAESVQNVLSKCIHTNYRLGLSGTLDFDVWTHEWNVITGYIGKLVNKVSASHIIDIGFATPVNITMLVIDYATDVQKKRLLNYRTANKGKETIALRLEHEFIIQNSIRTNYIISIISKVTKNSLVLFRDIKNGYGKLLMNLLREITHDKEIFYIDGSVSTKHRDFIKLKMEQGTNKILFASFKTFATGISIKNIHNIFTVESYKSSTIIKQAIGRGMRKHKTKEFVNYIDFVDNLTVLNDPIEYLTTIEDGNYDTNKKYANFDFRQARSRYNIYKKEEHKINIVYKDLKTSKKLF